MKIVDANVLVYAVDETAGNHKAAKQWIESALDGDDGVGFPWVVLLAFVRLTTNGRIFANPLTPEQATNTVATWLAQPAAFVVEPTERHLEVLARLLHAAGSGGNLVTDAHIAALAHEHGAEVVSFDSDFKRFAGIRWTSPMSGSS